jgi:hypothetical protein
MVGPAWARLWGAVGRAAVDEDLTQGISMDPPDYHKCLNIRRFLTPDEAFLKWFVS